MAAPMAQNHIVEKAPRTAIYIPNFITKEEEAFLLNQVYSSPKPKWHQLAHRRLQNWGGLPHPKGMIAEQLPEWLQKYVNRVNDLKVFEDKKPNHVLVNEYLPGQGIMPHTDGPLFYPTISTINLGSHTLLRLYEKPNNNLENESVPEQKRFVGSFLLRPRSLLILKDDLYNDYHHGIDDVVVDNIDQECNIFNEESADIRYGDALCRETRVSLTIRHVPKTITIKFR